MNSLLTGVVLMASLAPGALPPKALLYLPVLQEQIVQGWPGAPMPETMAGQIEQETCITMTHSSCWNPRAEIKTDREYGFGFVQITVTKQFNNFEGVKKLDAKLQSWKWQDRFDPARQLRAAVVLDRTGFAKCSFAATDADRMAFMYAAHNGGLGGVMQDRQLTRGKGADPNRWFGQVEKYSFKAKIKVKGYGKSFFEINREYVRNIMLVRSAKYRPFFCKKTLDRSIGS